MHEVASQVLKEEPEASPNLVASASKAQEAEDYSVLFLFSGPLRPDDGLGRFLQKLGVECVYVDREVDELHDLLDQDVWEKLFS